MKLILRVTLVCAVLAFGGFLYSIITGNDLKKYVSDNAIVKEVKVNVHNALADVDLDNMGLTKLTEVTESKAFNETQSFNFIKNWLPANYTCKYTYKRGSLTGTGNLTLYTGELGVSDNGTYVDVAWVTQKFNDIKEIAGSNCYYGENGTWYLCNVKEKQRSVTDITSIDFDVYKLLTQICNEQNYCSSTISNIVNLGAFDIDMFKYDGTDYLFFYDTKGVLAKIVNVQMRESYDFTAFSAPKYEKAEKYAAYKIV